MVRVKEDKSFMSTVSLECKFRLMATPVTNGLNTHKSK